MTAEQYYRENIHRPEIDWYGDVEITLTLMKEFALLKCQEQRQICAELPSLFLEYESDKELIYNSPNPEM